MKRIVICVCVLLILVALGGMSASAADEIHRMTHGDDEQDALLVGKIIAVEGDDVIFNVVRTVLGTSAVSPFRLTDALEDYTVGDGLLVSVYFSDDSRAVGTRRYGEYRVQLMQDKKIRMLPSLMDYGTNSPLIEWRVNVGTKDALVPDDGCLYRWRGNSDSGYKELLFDGERWHVSSLDAKYIAPEVVEAPPLAWVIGKFIGGVVGAAIVVAVIVWAVRHRPRRRMY